MPQANHLAPPPPYSYHHLITGRRWPGGKFSLPGSRGGSPVLSRLRGGSVAAVFTLAALCPALLISNLYTGDAHAADVCNNSPAQGDRIVCRKAGVTSTGNIDIDVSGIDIDTTADEGHQGTNDGGHGIILIHEGSGNIDLNIAGTTTGGTTTPSTIDTTGDNAQGIVLWHHDQNLNNGRAGNVTVTLSDTEINTSGSGNIGQLGIWARNSGNGDLTANLNPGVTISTNGNNSTGIRLLGDNFVANQDNDVILNARGITVTTQGGGSLSNAIWAERQGGRGDVRLDVRDSTLSTTGDGTYGIRANSGGGSNNVGDIDIDLEGGRITTNGYLAHGIYAHRQNEPNTPGTPTGNIEIRTRNHAIETTGTALYPTPSVLDGNYSYGMLVSHESDGNIIVDLEEGSSVTTHGKNSHGIVTYHYGDQDSRSMDVTVSGSITTNGEAAQGVRMGTGGPARMAGLDSQGYRRQTATVNGSITSTGEGVYLANGGRVIIGPEGRIRSGSGTAILATGTVPAANSDPAIPPKLRVDFNLDGRQRVADAIGDDRIVNDGGETTIAVNGTVLHDGSTGVTGATAVNGVWDVTMLADGLTVGSFSVSDFDEEVVRTGPPGPEPDQPSMLEEYAPRAALYESLPGLLLRLDAGAPVRRPEEPAWAQVGYGVGRGEADHSETGASYDFDRIEAAAGISRAWGDNLGGSLWLRRLQSEVKVDMPKGSGELELHGVGAGMQANWHGADGLYASGELSWTDFDVDAVSEKGQLAKDVGAELWQARLEAGYLMARGGGLTLRPRAWAWHAEADVDGFTDAVGAQVSGADESRTAAGLGLRAELEGSESSLYGSVDVESVFAGEETTVRVSGQDLDSESEKTRVWIGMGGQQQGKRVTLRGGLRLGDPGGRNQEVSASVSVSGSF